MYLFYVYKLNLFIINAYEMFPVFFLTPAIKKLSTQNEQKLKSD